MMHPGQRLGTSRWTRGRVVRAAAAGGAVAGGAALLARGSGGGVAAAAPSRARDAEILGFFLQLEHVQEGLYRAGMEAGRLDGRLQAFVRTVAPQESRHVAFLSTRAGSRAGDRPKSDFSAATRNPDTFLQAAIDLEELTLAAYIGQGANLTRGALADVARLLSVEARHAAWLRDLAGAPPAPRAADPPSDPDAVLEALRRRSYIQ